MYADKGFLGLLSFTFYVLPKLFCYEPASSSFSFLVCG